MSKFVKRLTKPNSTNKYYNSSINPFVLAGFGMFQNKGNCTAYAFGRVYELLGRKPKLSTANAENWFNNKDGYERGKTPKVGAVACFRKGKAGDKTDGAGHVHIVEQVLSNGDYIASESGWNSYLFRTKKYKKADNYETDLSSSYHFQGFIYPPYDFESDSKPSESNSKPSEVIHKVMKGDNLSKVAKKYKTSVNRIYNVNKTLIDKENKKRGIDLSKKWIYPGQRLVIK